MPAALQTLDTRLKRLQLGERLVRRNPLYYASVQRQLAALQDMGLMERATWTRLRLDKVLRAAARTQYGRSVGAPVAPEKWPLLHKESVRNDPRAFHSGRTWFGAQAVTGGTTGTPLQLLRSPQAVVAEQVCLDRMMLAIGTEPLSARVAVLRADSIKDPSDRSPPYWIYAMGGRRLILSSNHLTEDTLSSYVDVLREFRPDVLWVYPTALEALCRLLALAGERVRIRNVLSSSEMLHPQVWALARSLLDCQIVDYYGQAERVAFAYATAPDAYLFLPGYAYVELIHHAPEDGRRPEESATLYEIVGTSLWNLAMPLVRYRTGDLLRLPRRYRAQELLELACGLRPFEGVIGRSQDVLLAPDGRGALTGINHIPRAVQHLMRLQVVQEAVDRVVLRALVAPGFSDADSQQLLDNARQKIPQGVDVRVEIASSLQRTARGKTPFIIHSPAVREAFRAAGFHVGV
jgi:phenylacetate-CoA ligase